MNLKELMGDKWREDLTAQEIAEFLESAVIPAVEEKDDEPQEKMVSKELFDKTASQLAAMKREAERAKKEKLSVEDQKAEQIKELQNSIMRLKAEKAFAPLGVDPADLLDNLLDNNDLDGVISAMTSIISNVREEAVSSAKQELMKSSPKPKSAPSPKSISLKEMTTTERMEFAAKNPEQYQQMLRGEN